MVVGQSPPPPLPLLIPGIAGVAGYNAFHYFRARYPGQVIGTRRADNWPLAGPGVEPCEWHDRDSVLRLFDRYQFASILNCEGICKLKSCELDPALADRVNVQSARNILAAIRGTSTRLVHMSVDLVFSGNAHGGHVEEDPPDPVTVYGKTMFIAERLILEACPHACILRISLPMGFSFNGHAGAIDWIQSRFRKSKPATLFYDEIRTPKYTDCLSLLCETVLANGLAGLFHAGGPRRLSLYEIAQIVNRVGGYDARHLVGCYRHEAGPVPPRAGNVTMDSSKLLAALGYDPFDPWPLDDRWVPTHRRWHEERPTDETRSPELLARILCRNPARHQPGVASGGRHGA
jgi:dTDP-4-dehydrorhamnose reductase